MEVDKYGNFSETIAPSKLKQGLRPSKRAARDSHYLVEADGVVGKDGVLSALEALTRMATTGITDAFPFPQIFICTNVIIVCSLLKIYEWVSGALVLKYTAAEPAGTWTVVDYYDYIYLSNGKIAVIRDAGSKVYALDATQPHSTVACNYNGQMIIGSADVDGLAANLMMPDGLAEVTLAATGTMTVI